MVGEQTGAEGSPGKSEADAAGPEADGAEAKVDDLKQKFRAALDRKRDQQVHANAEAAQGTGRVHDAHGRAPGRRSFRRKSG